MRSLTPFLLLFLLLCSCERRPLIDPGESGIYAEIAVEFDWSLASMQPGGMTAIFYPEDGSAPMIHKTGDNLSTVRLRAGGYHVVGFNYSFDEFDVLRFRGTEHYETLEAYAVTVPTVASGLTQIYNPIGHPDILAACHVDDFVVTDSMVAYTTQVRNLAMKHSQTRTAASLLLRPVRVVAPGYVKVHLKGVNYLRSAGGVVTGLSESVFLATGKGSPVSACVPLDFTTPVFYEGSKINGIVSGSYTTFGMLPSQTETKSAHRYGFLFSSVLLDKERSVFEQWFDVAGRLEQTVDVNLNTILRLDLELGRSQNPDDNTPTIVVPQVQVEDEGAFDVNVGDWGEEENVYL